MTVPEEESGLLVPADLQRIYLNVTIEGASLSCWLVPGQPAEENTGWLLGGGLTPAHRSREFKFSDQGGVLQEAWNCFGIDGEFELVVVEVFFQPEDVSTSERDLGTGLFAVPFGR